MPVIVDTSVWSLGLRRKRKDLAAAEKRLNAELKELILNGEVILPGVIRQELLTGIADERVFDELSDYLHGFDDPQVDAATYELAARFANICAAAGLASSVPDMLICSFAFTNDCPIFTTDGDFVRYAKLLPVQLRE